MGRGGKWTPFLSVSSALILLIVAPVLIGRCVFESWKLEHGFWIVDVRSSSDLGERQTASIGALGKARDDGSPAPIHADTEGFGMLRSLNRKHDQASVAALASGLFLAVQNDSPYRQRKQHKKQQQQRPTLRQVWNHDESASSCSSNDQTKAEQTMSCVISPLSPCSVTSLTRMISWLGSFNTRKLTNDATWRAPQSPPGFQLVLLPQSTGAQRSGSGEEAALTWTLQIMVPATSTNGSATAVSHSMSLHYASSATIATTSNPIPPPRSGWYLLVPPEDTMKNTSINANNDEAPLHMATAAAAATTLMQPMRMPPSKVFVSISSPAESWFAGPWQHSSHEDFYAVPGMHGYKTSHVRGGIAAQAWHHPTTTFFWLLNVGLYLMYWNSRVSPALVAINGSIYREYGRAFSGCLAHFDLWHIGFNMMSWWSLGLQLEPHLGSLPFFMYTTALIPLTTVIMLLLSGAARMLLQQHQAGWHHATSQLISTVSALCRDGTAMRRAICQVFPSQQDMPNTVGFSGVLFAWMVVATLSSPHASCPIFFLPQLCFETMEIFGMRFNLGPIVQLVVLQVILPRVSFFGHLAGIVLGFAIHWGLLPLEWANPAVTFPLIWLFGKVILRLQNAAQTFSTDAECAGWNESSTSNPWSDQARHNDGDWQLLQWAQRLHLVALAVIVVLFDGFASSGLVVSNSLSTFMLALILLKHRQMGTNQHNGCCNPFFNTSTLQEIQSATIARGYCVVAVVVIMADCLYYGTIYQLTGIWSRPALFWALHSLSLSCKLVALCAVSHWLATRQTQSASSQANAADLFRSVMKVPVLDPSCHVARCMQAGTSSARLNPSLSNARAFAGQGNRLGGGNQEPHAIAMRSHRAERLSATGAPSSGLDRSRPTVSHLL